LYDLAKDIGESRDLAASQPAQAAELQALWDAWNAEQAEPLVPDQPAGQRARARQANRQPQRQNSTPPDDSD